jgi:hypothetical protein
MNMSQRTREITQVFCQPQESFTMSKFTTSRKIVFGAAAAALLAACASVGTGVGWNILPAGSTWQVSQRNTGSYGKDTTYQVTRGEAVWQGRQMVSFTNSANGSQVLVTPDGRWASILGRDGSTIMTYDPPIGYVYPRDVSWTGVDTGIHPKQELQRLPNHPQGAGTQQNQLMAMKRPG